MIFIFLFLTYFTVRGRLTLRNPICCHFSAILYSLSVPIPGTSEQHALPRTEVIG